jgi:Beta-glucosidase-related glycosidases
MKKIFVSFIMLCALYQLQAVSPKNKKQPVVKQMKQTDQTVMLPDKSLYFKSDPKMDEFITHLISQMTLTEKLGQLNLPSAGDFTTGQAQSSDIGKKVEEGKVGGLFNIKGVEKIAAIQRVAVEKSRLKIPILFGMDVIHGYVTNFPIPLGLASSWDMALIEQSARIAANEATSDGINWTFSPMVDIARDPRWGRIAEGSGEDTYLGGQIAKAMVHGYQGDDLSKNNTMMACVKHYALYGAAEAGRDYNTVDMSRVRMYNEYFPSYKAAIDAGVGTVMASFNEVDGIPATANRWLQTEVLRNQWGFGGFVVTDYTGINEMMAHGIGNLQKVSARALNAGIDMDMVGEGFLTTLQKSLDESKVTQSEIDRAVRRILESKYRLGLFDDPYKYCDAERGKREVYNKANRDADRNIAARSMVLMENKQQTLPLRKSGTIALIGPLANNPENMPGTWSVAARHSEAISLLKGLQETVGKEVKILCAKGCNFEYDAALEARSAMFGKNTYRDNRPKEEMLKEALDVARQADVIVAALGEDSEMSGECSSRTRIDVPQSQRDLLVVLKKTGKPVVLVLFTGRPLVLNQEKEFADAILNVWFPGSEAGYAVSDVLFGKVNPSGKLPVTFPRNVGQIPIYYNYKNTGRPLSDEARDNCRFEKFRSNYLDECNTPLYPFGYGLSYTTFQYGDITLSAKELNGNQTLKASVTVTNTGKYDGAEVVQFYIRDVEGSITRPVKELKGFRKIDLKVGETQTVTFDITPEDLKFYNNELQYDWEGGEFEIQIGTNSRDVKMARVNWMK